MLNALLSDRVGANLVMSVALTAFLAANIISIKEGLAGFANLGLLTVLILFVDADVSGFGVQLGVAWLFNGPRI